MPNQENCVFDYAGRQLIVSVADLEDLGTEVLAVPTSNLLNAQGVTAQRVYASAGKVLQEQIRQLCREYENFDVGMAVFTDAGSLSYQALIHAIGHPRQESPARNLIELAYTNSLLLCEFNSWRSITFSILYPADDEICSVAAARAIIRFWDARMSSVVESVVLNVPVEQLAQYVESIETLNTGPSFAAAHDSTLRASSQIKRYETDAAVIDVAEVDLSGEDLNGLQDDDEISDWFR